MQTSDVAPERLRALAEARLSRGAVLSLYLNLEPSEFATPQARDTAVTSLLDEAQRQIDDAALEGDERRQLRDDLARAEDFLRNRLPADGAHGLALFVSAPLDLFEPVRLSRAVRNAAIVDSRPYIEPLAELADATRWAVLLVSRRNARVLRGTRDQLREVAEVADDVHGQHDQGGWSQARYERSVEQDVGEHLKNAAEALFRSFHREPFDALIVGGPEETVSLAEEALHSYLRERLAGRITVDVDTATPDEVLQASEEVFVAHERKREREALDRLEQGLGGAGRSAAGWDDVLESLNERRVETLLLDAGARESGGVCPQCGWLGRGRDTCPVDGTALGPREDMDEAAVEAALRQSAEVIRLRHHDLGPQGGVGAVLRF